MVNPDISNGTCYFSQDSETQGDFISCGNIAFGNWPCCKTGDVCLGFETANACYDYTTGNTYIAGCTDPSYADKTCPSKLGFDDQEWVAIDHCGTDSNGDTDWGGCKNSPANETALTKLPNSSCDPYCATTLWVGGTTIDAYATVPSSSGGSVTWTNDFNPTSTSRTAAIVSTATTSPTSTHTSQPDSGLGTGAKVGIGIGTVGAVLLIAAVVLLSLLVRRRRKKRSQAEEDQQKQQQQQQQSQLLAAVPLPPYPGDGGHNYHHHHQQQQQPEQMWQAGPKPGEGQFWGPGNVTSDTSYQTGFKHELPAETSTTAAGPDRTANPHHSMVSSTNLSTVSPILSTTSLDYRAGSMGQGTTNGFYVSPQSTGTGYHAAESNGHDGHVSELQG